MKMSNDSGHDPLYDYGDGFSMFYGNGFGDGTGFGYGYHHGNGFGYVCGDGSGYTRTNILMNYPYDVNIGIKDDII